jgi:cytochrome c-type biogenesis protein CcmH/NrfF
VRRGNLASRAALLLAAGMAIGLASPAPASAGEEASWGYALAHELMSPFCPGRTLAACPSDKAAEVRQWILLQQAAGATRDEVIAQLYEQFGDVILSSPEPEGWGLAAWLLPGFALGVGALIVMLVLRRMTGGADPSARTPAAAPGAQTLAANDLDDAELERVVDEDLRASGM